VGPVDPALAPFLARLPTFGAPPIAQPIRVPAGPTVPIYKRLPVTAPVAFLTMDDGYSQLPQAIPLMQAAHIPFTMFLIQPVAAKNPTFFKKLVAAGGVIEDHTITHPDLRGKGYGFQQHEICDARTSLQRTFGTKITFVRPPFGDYDQTTLRVAHDCGLKAAFYWSETVNGGKVYYQTSVHKIRAGDIILMHFRPAFVNDVIAALTAIHDAGLTPALLEDYLA
jgi:peptidoglycan/xylan/chitin deacetylase (PgdA/CDA1 family)